MNKAKTAKVLSAAAVANMAAIGFATSPAAASTHPAAATAGGVAAVPSAGRPHPGVIFTHGQAASALKGGTLKAGATTPKPRGFVPRGSSGVKPDTETGCSSTICVGLYGGGNHVSYFNAHWFAGSPSSPCRGGKIWYREPNGGHFSVSYESVCYKQQITLSFSAHATFPTGTKFCASFSSLGSMCEPVR
jgi:hypothetical protein